MIALVALAFMVIAETVALVHLDHQDAKTSPVDSQARAETNLPSQSWDQENLKRNDAGCPTAVYVAPGGNLEQCQ